MFTEIWQSGYMTRINDIESHFTNIRGNGLALGKNLKDTYPYLMDIATETVNIYETLIDKDIQSTNKQFQDYTYLKDFIVDFYSSIWNYNPSSSYHLMSRKFGEQTVPPEEAYRVLLEDLKKKVNDISTPQIQEIKPPEFQPFKEGERQHIKVGLTGSTWNQLPSSPLTKQDMQLILEDEEIETTPEDWDEEFFDEEEDQYVSADSVYYDLAAGRFVDLENNIQVTPGLIRDKNYFDPAYYWVVDKNSPGGGFWAYWEGTNWEDETQLGQFQKEFKAQKQIEDQEEFIRKQRRAAKKKAKLERKQQNEKEIEKQNIEIIVRSPIATPQPKKGAVRGFYRPNILKQRRPLPRTRK